MEQVLEWALKVFERVPMVWTSPEKFLLLYPDITGDGESDYIFGDGEQMYLMNGDTFPKWDGSMLMSHKQTTTLKTGAATYRQSRHRWRWVKRSLLDESVSSINPWFVGRMVY